MPVGPPESDLSRRALLGIALGVGAAAVAGCDAAGSSPSEAQSAVPNPSAAGSTGSDGASAARPSPSATGSASSTSTPSATSSTSASAQATASTRATASDAQILARSTVPVLCWHQLRNWTSADSSYARELLICPPAKFRAQLDAIAEDNWTTIGPEEYLAHLTTGAALPAKPIMLSFDDSQGSQITEGLPQLQHRKMTGTFFAMTVVLGKHNWFTRDDLKRLDAAGMTVAAHTWDHHRVDQYSGKDWSIQLSQPKELLEQIIGKPVEHFAYPYGAWDEAALPHVKAADYKTAFQLADKKPDAKAPLYTLRRDLVSSTWSGKQLLAHLRARTS